VEIQFSKKRGRLFQKCDFLKDRKRALKTSNAIVLTGANGAGKTVLLNSLAFAAGLGDRYSSSKTSYRYSSVDARNAEENFAGASLYEEKTELKFDVVLRFRGEEAKVMPIALDTEEDMAMISAQHRSHGQANIAKLGEIMKECKEEVKKNSKILLAYDEPETGLDLETQILVARRLYEVCEAVNRHGHLMYQLKIIVATQNPFILAACVLGGATRIDMGGWMDAEDLFKKLEPVTQKALQDLFGKGQKP